MKKNPFFQLAATAPAASKSSNWKFGWSPSSVETQIEGRRHAPRRAGGTALGIYGVPATKSGSSW